MSEELEKELVSRIEDLIQENVYIRDVPYSLEDGAKETDPDSISDAAKAIVKLLKENNYV